VVGGLFALTVVGSIPVLGWLVSLTAAVFAIAATTRPPAARAVARAAAASLSNRFRTTSVDRDSVPTEPPMGEHWLWTRVAQPYA
jgi:hypothetical protein